MLHYYAKDFFAPVIVTPHLSTSRELSIYVISDQLYPLTGYKVEICIYKWKSMKPIFTTSFSNITIVSSNLLLYQGEVCMHA